MSDSKFDDKIKKALEGHEPEVDVNWEKMRDRIAAAAAIGAVGVDAAGSKIATQLSIGTAVVIGAVSMWIAQTFIEDDVVEECTVRRTKPHYVYSGRTGELRLVESTHSDEEAVTDWDMIADAFGL